LSDTSIPSSISNGLSEVLAVRSSSASSDALLVWLEQGAIKYVPLAPNTKPKPKTFKAASKAVYSQIQNVGLSSVGQFVALKADRGSTIIKIDVKSGELTSAWEHEPEVTFHVN
jgi:hypothetical protein